MKKSSTGPRLIIVCGLPGSGKTTLAKMLESEFRAIRLCPDEWIDALSLDLYDEDKRGKIEALQWKFAQQLLALGLVVIIEWALGEDPSGIPCDSKPELLALRLSCIIYLRRQMSFLKAFNAGVSKIRPSSEKLSRTGSKSSKHRHPRR